MNLMERYKYKITGIYKITNNITNEAYIGQAKNISARIYQHLNSAISEKRSDYDYPLHRAFRKYGIDNFNLEILEKCEYVELNKREQYWIEKFDTCNNGYNQTSGGYQSIRKIKLTQKDVDEIYTLLRAGNNSCVEIGALYNICPDMVTRINSGEAWHNDTITYPVNKDFIFDWFSAYHYTGVVINQYDKQTGQLLNKFPNVSVASQAILANTSGSHHIGEVITNKRKSAYGYLWSAEEATKAEWLELVKRSFK